MATRPTGYGLTGEVNRKLKAKYDTHMEQEAREWIETVVGEQLVPGADPNTPLGEEKFQDALKDGVILCRLINILQPGSVNKINEVKAGPFKKSKDMENIGHFLEAIEKYGVKKVDQFMTANLTDRGNGMHFVVTCLHALGRRARNNGFQGPTIGPKEAEHNPRNFDESTLQAGQAVIGFQYGYTEGANQKGMNLGKTRSIVD